jgi:hypothetical protein
VGFSVFWSKTAVLRVFGPKSEFQKSRLGTQKVTQNGSIPGFSDFTGFFEK